jgi:alpha-beta hydrolase superfamily lysophospholipase
MQTKEFSMSTTDGLKLYVKEWQPEGSPKATIALVHGLGEHVNRYEYVAKTFTEHGYLLRGFDLRGHGQSEGKRGHAPSYARLAEDINQLLQEVHDAYPELPIFLYGHSLGGALVLYYGETHQFPLRGIIATSPGLGPAAPLSAAKMTAAKILSRIMPAMQMPNDLDLSGLSHDPEVAEKYKKDPLVHPLISARLGMELISNGKLMIDHASQFPYPLLLLQGSADRLVNPSMTAVFAGKVPPELITYQVFEGYYHELHNEPQKDQVLAVMTSWLDQHLL